ncbi:MAG: DUF928 domain-containing protein [Methylococcales bacterium]|nr:DUF928 domain-containing protein [Methylococcales bacterium]
MNKKFIPLIIFAMSLSSFTSAEGLLVYKPPQINAPQTRIGGGTRSLNFSIPKIQVLAPKQIALTSQSQPTLYWYSSESNQQTIEFILIEEGANKPLLEKRVSATNGLNSIRLIDNGVVLQQAKKYQWSLSVLNDSENANAAIIYQIPTIPLSTLEQKAENGYWYDTLQQLIESHSPLANDLLKQIGLDLPAL